MNKHEFSAMYLPHDVKAIDKFECIWTIHPYKDALDGLKDDEYLSYENFIKEEGHRLILHPLPDLTKPIEHKGEKFVPIDWLEDKYYTLDLHKQAKTLIDDTADWIFQCDFLLVLHLIEWHFDIADLISKGEAIDVNTLPENPYK